MAVAANFLHPASKLKALYRRRPTQTTRDGPNTLFRLPYPKIQPGGNITGEFYGMAGLPSLGPIFFFFVGLASSMI